MNHVRTVVVVGSSGSGKTTLVDGLRSPAYRPLVVVPRRFVTRSGRPDDDPNENLRLSRGEFQSLAEAGRIHPYWHRMLEHGREERYGFERIDEADRRLRVFAANNALLRDGNASVLDVLETAVVVVVVSERATRDARLAYKDMPADERCIRLADDGEDLLAAGRVARIIDTTELAPHEGQRAMRLIADELLAGVR